MAHPLIDQLGPLAIVARRIRPTGEDRVVGLFNAPLMTIRLRLHRQSFGHEADLDQRFQLTLDVGVEDSIDDRPVVARTPGDVFGVCVCRTPFQRGGAIAGCE